MRLPNGLVIGLIWLSGLVMGAAAMPVQAQASPSNAMQPGAVHFGEVPVGQHPGRIITVKNVTGAPITFTRFDLAGAGGGKFTYTWRVATCEVGLRLQPGESCTLRVRVIAKRPEWWQSVASAYFRSQGSTGQFNGAVFAHVV